MNSTIELTVRNKDIHIRKSDKITTGQQLNKIDIFFDGNSWTEDNFKVDVVFRIDNRFYRVTAEEEPMDIPKNKHLIIDIPPNVGASINLGKVVFIGIRGTQKVGDTYQIVYPTPYFRLGVVEKGANPIDTIAPEKATQTAYDQAVEKANAAANAAKQSEANAKQSETNAKTSETNAENSAIAAKQSETNAKTSETNAKTSEDNAKNSATAAKQSETNAKTSENNAAASANTAAGQATIATAKASEASQSATAAEASKTKAAESEANAKTSEINAAKSETNAGISETNARTSETNAAKSASDAQLASEKYPNIDDHGHWIRWNGTAWVDTGALAKFTIFKTYSTIEAMYANWDNIHTDYYNNFVLIASQPKANPDKDESIEDDNGKLFVILQEKKVDGNDYEKNGFSCVGDLSGAQGIQGESAYDIAVAKGQYTGTLDEFAKWTAEAANNEPGRVKAEKTRDDNENTRIVNETTREGNETTRKNNETYRQSREDQRNNNEEERIAAETLRESAENERFANENTRKSNENTRKENETARVTAEQTRISNESARQSNETARESAENERKSNETTRESSETERKSNEQIRVDNETARVFAESARALWEEWDSSKTYVKGNKVSCLGSSYYCQVDSTTNKPTLSSDWLLIAKKGDGVVIQDVYDTIDNLRAAHPTGDEYIYQVTGQNSEFFIWSELQSDWISIGSLGRIYEGGDGIQVDNVLISARLGSGLKFDVEKKIAFDESVFVEYTNDEITKFYNDVKV